MKKPLLLLCLALPASAAPFHVRSPHRGLNRAPHNRTPMSHSQSNGYWNAKGGLFSGHIGHRTTNK